jgi:bifunctional DNase/RNase
MGRKVLNIIGVSSSNSQHNTFALVLGVNDTNMRIPIIIGPFEAQAIAIELEGMSPSRPLTHDLMKNLLSSYDINVTEVYINRFDQGVFYSIIKLFDGKKVVEVDSRTSDAIALAVRFKCKIYVDDEVIKQTAMEEEMNSDDILVNEELDDDKMTIEELEDYLEELIKQENYEEASKIRDEIKRIKEEGY